MDPTTVIIVLSLHLMSSGGLLFLIGARTRQRQGLRAFGVAGMLFGLAYAGRLSVGLNQSMGQLDLLLDSIMLAALITLHSGARQYAGEAPTPWRAYVGLWLVFALAHGAAVYLAAATGRHVVLNLALGSLYAAVAVTSGRAAWRTQQGQADVSPAPLWALTTLTGVLGVATLARMVQAALLPTGTLFAGPLAQAFYGLATLCAVLLCPALLWMAFERLNDQLAKVAARDPLTGVLNRKGLADALERHFATRGHAAITVLMLDIDHFKRVNDNHGHAAGDAVLCEVGRRVQAQLRGSDYVARVGGEEFLVACPGLDARAAVQLGERIRAGIGAEPVALSPPGRGIQLNITACVGLAVGAVDATAFAKAWQLADAALYQAKSAGRDRVVVSAQ